VQKAKHVQLSEKTRTPILVDRNKKFDVMLKFLVGSFDVSGQSKHKSFPLEARLVLITPSQEMLTGVVVGTERRFHLYTTLISIFSPKSGQKL
jgi:hypothetical protein